MESHNSWMEGRKGREEIRSSSTTYTFWFAYVTHGNDRDTRRFALLNLGLRAVGSRRRPYMMSLSYDKLKGCFGDNGVEG